MCFLECLVDGATSHPWSVHENSVTLALRTKSTSMTNMASWPEHGRDADGSNPIYYLLVIRASLLWNITISTKWAIFHSYVKFTGG